MFDTDGSCEKCRFVLHDKCRAVTSEGIITECSNGYGIQIGGLTCYEELENCESLNSDTSGPGTSRRRELSYYYDYEDYYAYDEYGPAEDSVGLPDGFETFGLLTGETLYDEECLELVDGDRIPYCLNGRVPQVDNLSCVTRSANCGTLSSTDSTECAVCNTPFYFLNDDDQCSDCRVALDPDCLVVNNDGDIMECTEGMAPSDDAQSCEEGVPNCTTPDTTDPLKCDLCKSPYFFLNSEETCDDC